MGSRYLTDLADVCRNAGLAVLEQRDWQTRSRSSGGYNNGKPDHVMVHHTASGTSADGWPDCNYMSFNSSISPICNLYIDRAGTVYVLAGGATNTNGKGHDPCGLVADNNMNTSAIGIEGANDGVGASWPEAQQNTYVVLVAALCRAYNISPACVHSHFEYAPDRKVDPSGPSRWSPHSTGGGSGNMWIMTDFRADVADLVVPMPGPGPSPIPPSPGGFTPMWFCTSDMTGDFWIVAVDWEGQWASPIREIPQLSWTLLGPVSDVLNGPLKPVPHQYLQNIYDQRGRPATP